MLRPKVVVADEPVSALDVSIQAQVLNLLMDLQEEFGLAYLFISHGLSVVEHIADHLVVMYLGQPVEHGTKAAIFRHPRHPYTKALLASTPFVDPAKRAERVVLKGELPSPLAPPPGCAFHRRCPYATDLCHSVRRSCARWMGAWWPAIMRSRWGENRTDTIVAQLPFSLAAFESNPKGRWGVKRSGLRRSGRGRALAGGDSSGMATKYIGLAPPLPHSPRTVFGYRISPKGCTSLQHCHRISNFCHRISISRSTGRVGGTFG